MKRREFLQVCAVSVWPVGAVSQPAPGTASGWRTFEVTTRAEVLNPSGTTRVWIPAALISDTPYQRTLRTAYQSSGGVVKFVEQKPDSLGIVFATFAEAVKPALVVTSRVATRDHAIDLTQPRKAAPLTREARAHYTRATRLLPTDGIVRETAHQITRGATSDIQKARAIYDWVVDHTFRDPETRGCGLGDIRFMLESKDLGGKCADLNALFVGLARAAALPARDVYGIRIASSARGLKSLGTSSDVVTRVQHCRAEVFLDGYGWVPVDPADVRKVALEEPPGPRQLDDGMVKEVRQRLFGSWEMNWMAFNFAHDVALPGSSAPPLPFLMYPQAETRSGRLDSLDPDRFQYSITAREL